MLKDKDLLDYTINCIDPNDKFTAIYQLADELIEIGDDITRRAISLLNPLTQYSFLESLILEDKEHNIKMLNYLKSMKYPLPIKFGWKRTDIAKTGLKTTAEENEWFDDRHSCYCSMFKSAMYMIENCVDCIADDEIKIYKEHESNYTKTITLEVYGTKSVFEIYEIE